MSEYWSQAHRVFVVSQIVAITTTLIGGALSYVIPFISGHDYIFGLIPFFDVGSETSFPTYVSTVNLLVAAALCYLIYKASRLQQERPSRYWLVLCGLLVYLSVDEATMIHEQLGNLRRFFPGSDLIPSRHDWLLAGAPLAFLLGLAMLPFLFCLPRKLAISFLLAGFVFAFGVIGMEFVGSLMLHQGASPEDFSYQLRRLLEEAFEMYGVVIFNCAAAGELARRVANLKLVVRFDHSDGPREP